MSVPQLPNRRETRAAAGRDVGTPGRLPPVIIVLGAVALVVVVTAGLAVALLLFRGARAGSQEVVGSQLPPVWQPGSGRGVGPLPPAPSSGQAAPVGTVPPIPETEAIAPPPAEAAATPALPFAEGVATPGFGEAPLPPPVQEQPPPFSFEPPRLVYLPTPEYPRMGLRMQREGTVNLQVLVSANGHVLSAEPVGERLGLGFEAAARRAAFNARFEPARRNGEAVDAEARIAIRFRLQ
ncbi:MAG TPA: TonB family protein [Thermoanaerobaculia bacterium]|nr:TonB family protein [Thermoanaerobaculia bacterium]